jgi:hypothetical protein
MRKPLAVLLAMGVVCATVYGARAVYAAVWPNQACFVNNAGNPNRLPGCTGWTGCSTGSRCGGKCLVGVVQRMPFSCNNATEFTYHYCFPFPSTQCDDLGAVPVTCLTYIGYYEFSNCTGQTCNGTITGGINCKTIF